MNKQGIRNQVKALMNRNDFTDALADTFIDQGVARIQRTLRVPAMEKMEIYTASEQTPDTLILPNDFLELKHIYVVYPDRSYTLQYKDLDSFLRYPTALNSRPQFYTRIQGSLKMKPSPAEGDETILVYYGEIPDLVNNTDENFVTIIAPDLLIYGALSYAADYFVDERKAMFDESYNRIYAELVEQATSSEMNQSGLAVSPGFNYPEY
jgi:hypothetical protein